VGPLAVNYLRTGTKIEGYAKNPYKDLGIVPVPFKNGSSTGQKCSYVVTGPNGSAIFSFILIDNYI